MSVQARSNEITRWLAVGGIVGPVMFVVAFTVADIVRPGYSVVHQAISDLGVGSNPLLLNAPLVAMGVLLAAFIVGFTRGVPCCSRCHLSGSPGPASSPRLRRPSRSTGWWACRPSRSGASRRSS